MTCKHLSLLEREKLFGFLEQGYSHRYIAKKLNRSQSSLSREITRNTKYGNKYFPCLAQKRADRIGKNQRYKAPLKSPVIFLYVREHLRKPFFWSPEVIAGKLKLDIPDASIAVETIYRHIYSSKTRKAQLSKYLVRNHKKRHKQTSRSVNKLPKIPNSISIDNRAKYIAKRIQLGHWESDLMEGPRSSKPVLCVTVERNTRYTIINKLDNKKTNTKVKPLVNRFKKFPASLVKTLTVDNGSENTNHQYITQNIGIPVYFCHPYHSWEKGTVENTIGRIRRYLPKGTNLELIPVGKINQLEYLLNNTPRKCMGYLTPYEKMNMEIKKISKLT